MKHKALWALAGLGAAIGVYELFFASSHVPAGYASIPVSAGVKNPMGAPAGGQVGFVLPDGAHWTIAARVPTPGAPQVAVPLPSSTSSPLLVTGVTAGAGFMLSWTDATGAAQVTVLTFA
jgi:hypothetical protein